MHQIFLIYFNFQVDDMAAELGKQIASIAIGSIEGFSQADSVINMAVRSGR